MNIKKTLKKYLSNERGEGSIFSFLYILLFLLMCFYFAVDLYGYISQKQKLMLVANETLEIMKQKNGYDTESQNSYHNYLAKVGLDAAKITTVNATPGLVQRGEELFLELSMPYELKGFKPFGHTFDVVIDVRVVGLAHTFRRDIDP